MNDKQASEFESTKECNFAISPPGIGRFRVNAFVQQARVGMVLRTITTDIPKFEELGLPPVLKDIIMSKRGIMMFIGATGAGKSTSMASLLGYRNENSYGHIITIEDPIEFVHDHGNCIMTQREVGVSGIKEIMKKSRELGMQTFDQSLFELYEAGLITYEDALRNADSLNDLRLEIKLHGKEAKNRNVFAGIGNLDVVPETSNNQI